MRAAALAGEPVMLRIELVTIKSEAEVHIAFGSRGNRCDSDLRARAATSDCSSSTLLRQYYIRALPMQHLWGRLGAASTRACLIDRPVAN